MSNLARQHHPDFALTVLNGREKGATFKLMGGRISIGRASDNDIVIPDDSKMSRNHAALTITSLGVEIKDISQHNKVIVNGEEIKQVFLTPGAVVQLGETKFQYIILSAKSVELSPQEQKKSAPMSFSRTTADGGRVYFYVILGAILVAALWLFSGNKKGSGTEIKPLDAQTLIESNEKLVEKTEAERQRMGLNSTQYAEAQPNFIKGFRDYRKGQYERAIESFQACLSLFPQHQQCKTYLDRSVKKFGELVQYHMVLANKYRAQNQYTACKAAYRNVMIMLKNTNDKVYREAKSGYDACDALEGDRY